MNELKFNPPLIAHRGASASAPENTMAAFVKAAQLGLKWVEFDVTLASCGQVIVFHDDLLDRCTSGQGRVIDYPYHYLSTLDAGGWFSPLFSSEKIPLLAQVLVFLKEMKMAANIELKAFPGNEENLVKSVLQVVSQYNSLTDKTILFSSFSLDVLKCLRRHAPKSNIALLLHEWRANWEGSCESLECISVNVNEEIMTEAKAKQIKGMNKSLLCYTINNVARAMELYAWGVDAIFTDVPEQLLRCF